MNKKIFDDQYSKQVGSSVNEKFLFFKKHYSDYVQDQDFKLLEVGMAGSETLITFLETVKDANKVYAIDTEEEFVKNGMKIIGNNSSLQNICNTNFKDEHFNIIYVSSVIHEVYTYGYKNIVGMDALKMCFEELFRLLKKGGKILYRDVLTPENNLYKSIKYKGLSFRIFSENFFDIFLNSNLGKNYKNKFCKIESSEYITIFADSNFHREIQKHYAICMHNIGVIDLDKANNGQSISFSRAEETFTEMYKVDKDSLITKMKKWIAREAPESYVYLQNIELINFLEMIGELKDYKLSIEKFSNERMEEGSFTQDAIIGKGEKEGIQYLVIQKK